MKARVIKAVFEISEDSHNAGVKFSSGNKTITFDDMTEAERVKMLDSWAGFYKLFYDVYFKGSKEV